MSGQSSLKTVPGLVSYYEQMITRGKAERLAVPARQLQEFVDALALKYGGVTLDILYSYGYYYVRKITHEKDS